MAENEKYTYRVTKGNPMVDHPCTVLEEDEAVGSRMYYDGYYNPKTRTWRLYPAKRETHGNFGKKTLPERAVKMGK